MNLTAITVSYGATQSLPEYSNVKPQITLSAELEPGEHAGDVAARLWELARAEVHEQIDRALEAGDQRAKYDPAPRYDVITPSQRAFRDRSWAEPEAVIVVVPTKAAVDGYVVASHYPDLSGHRLGYALAWAADRAAEKGLRLIDCSDGDLSKIPPVPWTTKREPVEADAEPAEPALEGASDD